MSKNKEISLSAILLSLLIATSSISLPILPLFPPLTLQTLFVFLIALLFSVNIVYMTLSAYILAGAAGLPVFSGFSSGISVIFGFSGGFIIGFLVGGVIISILKNNIKKQSIILDFLYCLLGLFIIYTLGVIQFSIVLNHTLINSFIFSVLYYIIGDLIKIILAVYITIRLKKIIK